MKTWFGGDKDLCRGRKVWSEKGERERKEHKGKHKESISPKSLTCKKRGGIFHEFFQAVEF